MISKHDPITVMRLGAGNSGGSGAVVADSPGCRSGAGTPEKALANAYDAIGCWIGATGEWAVPSRIHASSPPEEPS